VAHDGRVSTAEQHWVSTMDKKAKNPKKLKTAKPKPAKTA
jgi:hypothetical protein